MNGGDGGTHVGCFHRYRRLWQRTASQSQCPACVPRPLSQCPMHSGRAFVSRLLPLASPPLADFIARHDWLRAGVRTLLWPLAWLAEALIPDAQAGSFFRPAESNAAATADKVSAELLAERQLLIKFTPAMDHVGATNMLQAQGAKRVEQVSPQLYLAEFPDAARRVQVQSAMSASPQVEYTEPNRVVSRPHTR
jgi:hypothetical protein